MHSLEKQIPQVGNDELLRKRAIEYINIGVGCNCLVSLAHSGALNTLLCQGYLSEDDIEIYENPLCLQGALATLARSEIVVKIKDNFIITDFGRMLAEHLGLITIFFDGYGKLIANQAKIARNKIKNKEKLMNGSVISRSSIEISEKMVEEVLLHEFSKLNLKGTICDLGCGYATMLSALCAKTNNPGLGFDSHPNVIKEAKKQLKNNPSVTLELADVLKLNGVWEDVIAVIQFHVFHDFSSEKKCIDLIDSLLLHFPNMKCFFYMDTVSPSATCKKLLPGFDYIHGLLGIKTRTYEETLKMFACSKYTIINEVEFPKLPNTFLWVLVPKTERGK